MNKELLLVATGIGIGALAFTEQGRKLMHMASQTPFLPQIGEGGGADGGQTPSEEMKPSKDDEDSRKDKEKDWP